MPFSDIHISQRSVATCLRCGGIFKHGFVADLLLSLPVEIGKYLVKLWARVWCLFLTHGVVNFDTTHIERNRVIFFTQSSTKAQTVNSEQSYNHHQWSSRPKKLK